MGGVNRETGEAHVGEGLGLVEGQSLEIGCHRLLGKNREGQLQLCPQEKKLAGGGWRKERGQPVESAP